MVHGGPARLTLNGVSLRIILVASLAAARVDGLTNIPN
jgi:hypothetical protein